MKKTLLLCLLTPIFSISQTFTKITTGDLVNDGQSTIGSYWTDYDGDGDLDVILFHAGGSTTLNGDKNILLRNDCGGVFTRISDVSVGGLITDDGGSAPSVAVDLNNDGYPEMVVLRFAVGTSPAHIEIFDNNGDGTFNRRAAGAILTDDIAPRSASAVDYDNDGWVDLFIGNQNIPNDLYHNNGNGTFTKITAGNIVTDVISSTGSAWGDYDNDGYMDLYVADRASTNNLFYHNNGDGTFTRITNSPLANLPWNTYGPTWVDYDNDLDLDMFVQNAFTTDFLFINNLNGGFATVTTPLTTSGGLGQAGASWGDYDNDGDLDCFIANLDANKFFINNGDGTFTQNTSSILTSSNGVQSVAADWVDYDNDGDLDLYLANAFDPTGPNNVLFQNDGNSNNWLKVKLTGTTSNAQAVGARIYVTATINGAVVNQMREINANSNLAGGGNGVTSSEAHFGIGDAAMIDTLRVVWPVSGISQIFTNILINEFYSIIEGGNNLAQHGACKVPEVNFNILENFALFANGTIIIDPLIESYLVEGNVGSDNNIPSSISSSGFITSNNVPLLANATNEISQLFTTIGGLPGGSILSILEGENFTQGVYHSVDSVNLNGLLSLKGNSSSIFILHIKGDLTIEENSVTNLVGVKPANVYYIVEGNVSIGRNTIVHGNIIAQGNISMYNSDQGLNSLISNGNIEIAQDLDFFSINREFNFPKKNGNISKAKSLEFYNLTKQPLLNGCGYLNSIYGSANNIISQIVYGKNSLYVTGFYQGTSTFNSTGSTITLSSTGPKDGYIAKYGSSGDLLWGIPLNSTISATVNTVVFHDPTDEIIVSGVFDGDIDFGGQITPINSSMGNSFIAKFDANGIIQWVETDFGGTVILDGSVIDSNGDVYFALLFGNSITLGGTTYGPNGGYLLTKRSGLDGTYLWSTAGLLQSGNSAGNQIRGLDYNPATGEVLVIGWHNNTFTLSSGQNIAGYTATSFDSYVVAYNANSGAFVWKQTFTTDPAGVECDLVGIAINKNTSSVEYGFVYLSGWSEFPGVQSFSSFSNLTPILSSTTGPIPFILKSNGNSFFSGIATPTKININYGWFIGSKIAIDKDDNLHMLANGWNSSYSTSLGTYVFGSNITDGALIKYDRFLNVLSFDQYKGVNNYFEPADLIVNDCEVTAAGRFDGSLDTYGIALSSIGGIDSWLLNKENGSEIALISQTGENFLCSGNTMTLEAVSSSTFATYTWFQDGVLIPSQNASSLLVNSPGLYNVEVATSCCASTAAYFELLDPAGLINIIPDNPTICFGESISLQIEIGSQIGTSTLWNTGSTSNNLTVSPTSTSTYTAEITMPGVSCPLTASSTVTVNPSINLSQGIMTLETCSGSLDGTATVNVSGGFGTYYYLWNDPLAQTTATATGLSAGSYIVQVSDDNGCTSSLSIVVGAVTPTTTSLVSSTNQSCPNVSNGEITVTTIDGTSPYSYQWDAGANNQTGSIASNLNAGTYVVTITDANGCTETFTATIASDPDITASIILDNNESCVGVSDGTSTVSGIGGLTPYTYAWDASTGNQTTATATGLSQGTYTVDVTDAVGCQVSANITIGLNEGAMVSDPISTPSCIVAGQPITFTNNLPEASSYIYNWLFGVNEGQANGFSVTHTYTEPGTYMVYLFVTDGCGNLDQNTMMINVLENECACDINDNANGFAYSLPGDTDDGTLLNNLPNGSTVEGTITVNNGLIIPANAVIKFGPFGKIVLAPGAELRIEDGATLTSLGAGCNYMWQGIELHSAITTGDIIPGEFSGVAFNPNSLIENAHVAVLLGEPNFCPFDPYITCLGNYDLSSSGGLVFANNATFRNNGINIKAVNGKHLNFEFALDLSVTHYFENWITNTTFESTGPLLDSRYNSSNASFYPNTANPLFGKANPEGRSTMGIWVGDRDGLLLDNNTFTNLDIGIESYDSKFDLRDFGLSTGAPSPPHIFNNLRYGIRIFNTNSSADNRHDISNAIFTQIHDPSNLGVNTNTTAIQIEGGRYDVIRDCLFGTPGAVLDENVNGIYLNDTRNVKITDNNFESVKYGIYVINSALGGGLIGPQNRPEGNIFNDCSLSVSTDAWNPRLRIRCNNHNNNNALAYSGSNWLNTGQLVQQGSNPPIGYTNRSRYGAGNEFRPAARKQIGTSTSNVFSYWHHIDNTPGLVLTPDVIGINRYNSGIDFDPIESCKPFVVPVISLPGGGITALQVIDNQITSLNSQKSTLQANQDGGNTPFVINTILNESRSNRLRNKLLLASPLSDEALDALFDNNILRPPHFRQVMLFNLPVNDSLLPKLKPIVRSLPRPFRRQLISLQRNNPFITTVEEIDRELNALNYEYQRTETEYIIAYLEDTINNDSLSETVYQLIGISTDFAAQQKLIATYIAQNRFTDAQLLLNNLQGTNVNELDWINYMQIYFSLVNNGDLYTINSIDQAAIFSLATPEDGPLANTNAKAFNRLVFDMDYPLYIPLALKGMSNSGMDFSFIENADTSAFLGNNFPNPFSNATSIPYWIPVGKSGRIIIYDIYGKQMESYFVTEGNGVLDLENKNWATGIYLYSLEVEGELKKTKRMVIQR